MTPILAVEFEEGQEHWDGFALARLGDYSDLGRRPWSELRKVEFLPGVRVGDDAYVVPKRWLPAGRRRDSDRTLLLADRYPRLSPSARHAWAESLRRTLVATLLPQETATGIREPALMTWLTRARTILRMASWVADHRPSDAGIWSHLSRPDWEAMGASVGREQRDEVGLIAERLLGFGQRGILVDYPRLSEQAVLASARVPPEPEGPVPEAARRGKRRPSERVQAVEPRKVSPFPDDFVTAVIARATWLHENLAEQLIECWAESRRIVAEAAQAGRSASHPDVVRRRADLIANRRWTDATGRPLLSLPWPVLMADGSPASGVASGMETSWPPRTARSIGMMVGMLQALNFCTVSFCVGARASEILSAGDDALRDGRDRLHARTFKLHDEVEGLERDWPIHPAAARAIEIQMRLSRVVRPVNAHHLWVLVADGAEPAGSEMQNANEPVVQAVKKLGLEDLLGPGRPHSHRWRHSVARLVALAVVHAPQVLMDLFGHRDLEMTFHYILSNPEIAREARDVAEEMAHALGAEAVVDVEANAASGPAAEALRSGIERLRMARGEERLGASTLREAVDILTFNGRQWQAVRPGVLCTKGLGMFGPCTKGRGEPDPGACRTDCGHRLELARARAHCAAATRQLLGELAAAKAEGLEMVVASIEGQVVANLRRWAEVREAVLDESPEAVRIWRDLGGLEVAA